MKSKIILFSILFFLLVNIVYDFVYFPRVRIFGTATTFTDSLNYVVLEGKGLRVLDSLIVDKDGFIRGKLYLDTARQGQIYFIGSSMLLSNTKSKGYLYFTTNQSFVFQQDISGSLVDIATLDTNGLHLYNNYLQLPLLNTSQRDLLSPSQGTFIYNTDLNAPEYFNGITWLGL